MDTLTNPLPSRYLQQNSRWSRKKSTPNMQTAHFPGHYKNYPIINMWMQH